MVLQDCEYNQVRGVILFWGATQWPGHRVGVLPYLTLQCFCDVGVVLVREGLGEVEQVYPVIRPHRSCGNHGIGYLL